MEAIEGGCNIEDYNVGFEVFAVKDMVLDWYTV
jgi:hypothetical protein